MVIGLVLWAANNRPLTGRKLNIAMALGTLLTAVLLGLIFSLIGWWMAGAGLLLITVLMIVVIAANIIQMA
jgi:hypothetical protein